MKIAVLGGTGDQGLGLALRLALAGEEVIIGSRDAEKAVSAAQKVLEIAERDDLKVKGATNAEAAEEAEVAILTVPLQAQMATLGSVKEAIKGKVLIDATVPIDSCLGGSAVRYIDLWDGSAAERAARFLEDQGTRVAAAFNNISASALLDITGPVDCDCLIASDHRDALDLASELAEKIDGVRAIDCGGLENARVIEKITPLLINLNIKNRIRNAGIRITNLPE
ncbi:F420-dependent NADP reductase [Methanothermobacter sp. KEPCO-1]|uniref:F420-dependent NADP reductase n=1 Tax=Methanothermobacter marburgensis (strain ATCC BAA-927 / DSM 2133 / JCM 14651 / NBRC 100331 / OCM 82 / Marburg) TaxID=79929 RepID=FNO_METTM|nr:MULTISPECIES: NADPH-dependent F420 reductase [Methanothermobacter]D9PVP5.1 RecName: Full=F420-dependent NADP reductase; AltName: Full=F420H2:NADP oxidoreductase [Methanothermobacter marburgensis str. Marburg]CAA76687.1 F420-dependent NADP reductase [Methanothermobacter thermautotrophicus]ADL58293.1 F420H2:NADP oxidoreductase [Methanothermobacter marburgensis str. Marburg]QEF93867.1 F420-dependent NADP reductase [Methanothermobacter sp. KEPCO-1]WBF10451.1 NADPH-dependent F420 reductase [Meth